MTEQHHWAAYSTSGDVLATGNSISDLNYRALYKAGLEGTVEAWPDRDRPMLQLTTVHEECNGTGKDLHAVHWAALDDNGCAVEHEHLTFDQTRDPGEVQTCPFCGGFGHTKGGRYGGTYKTAQSHKAGVNSGKANVCDKCNGRGTGLYMPIVKDCFGCSGNGKTPTWDASRPILPPQVSNCDTASPEFMRAWLESITITVDRANRGLTWGEAHLGIVGLGSCVDYGAAWDGTDDEVIDRVIEHIGRGEQYIKMINKETRTFGPALIVHVTTNGYSMSVATAPLAPGLGALPPTYFPTVFEEIR